MKFNLLIRNATVIDGTRAARFEADIGVSSGKISRIGKLKEKGEIEIDASGKIAAPGFIDAHTHDDRLMLSAPDMAPKVSQGVTTVVAGNCGVYLAPARAATTEEVIEVCRPLTARKGIYCTHMRDEGDRIVDSLEETFRIGRELGVPVVISHHKLAGKPNHGRSAETLPIIEKAMRSQKIGLDCYPYCASSTILSVSRVGPASKVLVTWSKPHPEFAGMELTEIASKLRLSVPDAVEKLLPAGAIYFSMDERDVQRILGFEHTMIGSDGLPHDGAPHPRLWGTFPRVLGHYSRGLNLFPLETAVYKMTGLTAKTFGLADRGVLKQGFAADIVVFDENEIDEAASFAKPIQLEKGI